MNPVPGLRDRVAVPAGDAATVVLATLDAPSREEALRIAGKHRRPAPLDRERSPA